LKSRGRIAEIRSSQKRHTDHIYLISIKALLPKNTMLPIMDRKLAEYAARPVPRYTSYPTAPHFKDQIDGTEYSAWLTALPDQAALSLYLHIPYCTAICHYCGCHTKATLREAPVRAYAETLMAELRLTLNALGQKRTVKHIHWGGGTPSLLRRECFEEIAEIIRNGFGILPDCEHAIELDPRTITRELATTLTEIGINRVSLGIQDFNPDVQLAIGRVQPFAQVEHAVGLLKDAGLTHICFDLMYGLPHQGNAALTETIDRAVRLQPSRIALFGYAHVPWMKKHQRLIDTAALPGTEARFEQAEAAADRLMGFGYHRIGLDHFALPGDSLADASSNGRLRRNFQGYTTDPADALLGFGVSSIGKLPQGFVQNRTDIRNWRQDIDAGILPISHGKRLRTDDVMRSDLIEELMCRFEVDVEEISNRHDINPASLQGSLNALHPLREDGLIEIDGSRIKLSPDRRAFVRLVAAAFDAYLPSGAARHSAAV